MIGFSFPERNLRYDPIMISILIATLLLQAAPQNAGTVTGVVRGAGGMPAAGVRVYAIAAKDAADTATAPLESQAQTDAAGRYRLEISAGRYYIGSGSVNAPTYYPGATAIVAARVVEVGAGRLVEGIDFSSYIPAAQGPSGLSVLQGTASISGTLRFPDGSPAGRIRVVAFPASGVFGSPPNITTPTTPVLLQMPTVGQYMQYMVLRAGALSTATDPNGAYTLPGLFADTFYVAAGFAESPTLYPGVSNAASAKTIVTTATTNLTGIDFTVPRPPPTFTISGGVSAVGDAPAEGAMVHIRSSAPVPSSGFGLPTSLAETFVWTDPYGRFQVPAVSSGPYRITVSFSGALPETRNIEVGDRPLTGVDFKLRLGALSGRLVEDDGRPFADAQLFGDAIVTTADNPNILASTILPIATDGTFKRLIEAGLYRFYLRTLPEEYSVRSITAGGVDLLREMVTINGTDPLDVEVRVGRRTASSDPSLVSVKGQVLDAVTGTPPPAARITLCCRESGPAQEFSAPLKSDGTFEFAAVPTGHYAVGLKPKPGMANLFVATDGIDVANSGVSGLEFVSTTQFGPLAATIVFEGGNPLPRESAASVVFSGLGGRVRLKSWRGPDGIYTASLPIGARYDVTVEPLPEGYVVKSVTGSTEPRPQSYPPIGVPPPPTPIVITLERKVN